MLFRTDIKLVFNKPSSALSHLSAFGFLGVCLLLSTACCRHGCRCCPFALCLAVFVLFLPSLNNISKYFFANRKSKTKSVLRAT